MDSLIMKTPDSERTQERLERAHSSTWELPQSHREAHRIAFEIVLEEIERASKDGENGCPPAERAAD